MKSLKLARGIPLNIENRVNNQVYADVQFLHSHAGGIYKKRQVVIGHFHDRMLTFPTVLFLTGVKHIQ